MRSNRFAFVLGTAIVLAGCTVVVPASLRGPSTAGLISEFTDPVAKSAATPTAGPKTGPSPVASTDPPGTGELLTGRILLPPIDLVSHGAASLISDNAARLISDNAANLISDNAAQLVSNNSAQLVGNNSSSYRILRLLRDRFPGLAGYGILAADWTESPTASARVAYASETGTLLSQVVDADAEGRFSLPVPDRAAFLVAEVANKIGMARIVEPGQRSADVTVDHTLVAMKAASLARRNLTTASALLGAPLATLAAEVRAGLTPGTLPYLDSGPGEVVSAFDQLVTDQATVSAKAVAASPQFADRRFEWGLTTVATGSEADPFAFGGYSIHPESGDIFFLPNQGFKEIGKLGPDGTITPVASLSRTVQLSFSSTVTATNQLYALFLVKVGGSFTIRLEHIDLATGTMVRGGDLYSGFDPTQFGGAGPNDGYSLAMGTIAVVGNTVYMPHSVFHIVYKVVPVGSFFLGSVYAGGLSQAAYQDGTLGNSRFNQPVAVTLAPDGALYVCDSGNFVVRKVELSGGGKVSTFAGSGVKGRESGKARFAKFGILDSVAVDKQGNAFVLDPKINHEVRWVSKAGQVFSLAGGRGEGVKDGVGLEAEFHDARFLQIAPDGTLHVVDRTGPGGTYYFKAIRPIPR